MGRYRLTSRHFGITLVVSLFFLCSALQAEAPSQPQPSLREKLVKVAKAGGHYLRVALVASDENFPHVIHAIEELEQGLEPPTTVEGFWKRKWELLKLVPVEVINLLKMQPNLLDLRRAVQNLRRIFHLSKTFKNPWLRDTLFISAMTFTFTHFGEFVTGAVMGTRSLVQFDFAAALAWYGLAIPGLYDFGCWIGQGLVFLRPSRAMLKAGVHVTAFGASRLIAAIGPKDFLQLALQVPKVQAKLQDALEAGDSEFDITLSDEELLTYRVKGLNGLPVLTMKLAIAGNQLTAKHVVIDKDNFRTLPYRELKGLLKPFGWNILGAHRQIWKLMNRDRADLISHEKTFVDSVSDTGDQLSVQFRDDAVYWIPRLPRFKKTRPAAPPSCPEQLAAS